MSGVEQILAWAVTSESSDLHVPEFHDTAAVLQSERAFGISAVLDVDGDRAIQRDQQSRAFSPEVQEARLTMNDRVAAPHRPFCVLPMMLPGDRCS